MFHRNAIFAVAALSLSSFALAAMVYTDAYTQAAQSEASGYTALVHRVSNDDAQLCALELTTPGGMALAADKATAQ